MVKSTIIKLKCSDHQHGVGGGQIATRSGTSLWIELGKRSKRGQT